MRCVRGCGWVIMPTGGVAESSVDSIPRRSSEGARIRTRIIAALTGLTLFGVQVLAATPVRAATVVPNVNITRLGGNQSEAAIAIDPLDPNHVVEFSNRERGAGMVLASSVDGGATWECRPSRATTSSASACCDPTMSWDEYGNLFMAWLDLRNAGAIRVAISVDCGPHVEHAEDVAPEPAPGSGGARRTRPGRGDGR